MTAPRRRLVQNGSPELLEATPEKRLRSKISKPKRDYRQHLAGSPFLTGAGCLVLLVSTAEGFLPGHQLSKVQILQRYSTMKPKEPPQRTFLPEDDDDVKNRKQEPVESNFWFSTVKKAGMSKETASGAPCFNSLDTDGPLPIEAYQILGDKQYEPPPTCFVSVAVNVKSSAAVSEPEDLVCRMQQFIDSGLTTFQLQATDTSQQEWAEKNLYGKLRSDTPLSVLRACQLVVPLMTPTKGVTRSTVRSTVLQSLHRIGGDCIDTLQLKYNEKSLYSLDVLDFLQDLKREGLIRSISSNSLSTDILRSADACGFALDSHQLDCSLLDSSLYQSQSQFCQEMNLPLFLASPLAGGLLTERHADERFQPSQVSPSERHCLDNILPQWADKLQTGNGVWTTFQRNMMDVLINISLKHQVTIATVALRWALQLSPGVASVIPSCTLVPMDDDRPYDRPAQLRQVFQLELDEEDMERLWDATGREEQPLSQHIMGEDDPFLDLSNRKLWL